MYKHQFAEDRICDVLLGFEGIEVGLASGRTSVREESLRTGSAERRSKYSTTFLRCVGKNTVIFLIK